MKVTYIDHMGDDLRVVNAARVSFHKESDWEPTDVIKDPSGAFSLEYGKALSEQDAKLIKYLATHNHWTPFSHCMVTLREKVPIFVARQRFKHMVGFTYNEVSRRYVDDEPEFYMPDVWRSKPVNAKQGSGEEMRDENGDPLEFFCFGDKGESDIGLQELSVCLYNNMIEQGVAPEMARMVLPQSMYTEYYVTGSLAAWARAYNLRIDPHAQKEIRDVAEKWGEIISALFPVSWEALTTDE